MFVMDLFKMGIVKVMLSVSDCGYKVIEKCFVGEVEYSFYQYVVMEFNQVGIVILMFFFVDVFLCKLILEYIFEKVEQNDVVGDDVIVMLVCLYGFFVNFEWIYYSYLWLELVFEKFFMFLVLLDKSMQ